MPFLVAAAMPLPVMGCSHNQPCQRMTTVGKNPKTTEISILKPSKNYTEMSAVSCICSSLSCPRMTEMSTWSRAPGGSSSTLIPPYSMRTTCLNAESCGKCLGEKHLLPFGTADCESTPQKIGSTQFITTHCNNNTYSITLCTIQECSILLLLLPITVLRL